MYESAQPEIDRILALVAAMPEEYRAKGFELLMQGYIATLGAPPPAKDLPPAKQRDGSLHANPLDGVPQELHARLKALATQSKVEVAALVRLFDFAVDPFTLGSFVVEGANLSEKARKLALLVGARSYVATGKWTADWSEVKAACIDHGCYDGTNFSKSIKQAEGSLFKSVESGSGIEISAAGQTDAKSLIATLVGDASNK